MNRLSLEEQAAILSCLVEGTSIRATSRITGAVRNTISRLFLEVAEASDWYQYQTLRNLPCKVMQVDEIWSFCYAKEKNLPVRYQKHEGYGNVWTWTAICADTKLVPCWLVADREVHSARRFLHDLSSRLAGRIQLTSDGYKAYPAVVEGAFGGNVNYSVLVKRYEKEEAEDGKKERKGRYIGSDRKPVLGNPDPKKISTSYVERQNLTLRMHNRRFTRKTNAFSKKMENHRLSVALHFMYYNFARIHQTLRVTPAMEAGVADHVWDMREIIGLAYPTSK